MCKIKIPENDTNPSQGKGGGVLPGGPIGTSQARDRAWAWRLGRGPLSSPRHWGPGGCWEKAQLMQRPWKSGGGWCLRKKGEQGDGVEIEERVWVPGLLGPVPALRMGPTLGVDSVRGAARIPTARSARGPCPVAPAAPKTRSAALVTGGGGRGDPAGLGVGRPGGRETDARAAAPPRALSLLSIPHLMKRQTGQHPRS